MDLGPFKYAQPWLQAVAKAKFPGIDFKSFALCHHYGPRAHQREFPIFRDRTPELSLAVAALAGHNDQARVVAAVLTGGELNDLSGGLFEPVGAQWGNEHLLVLA